VSSCCLSLSSCHQSPFVPPVACRPLPLAVVIPSIIVPPVAVLVPPIAVVVPPVAVVVPTVALLPVAVVVPPVAIVVPPVVVVPPITFVFLGSQSEELDQTKAQWRRP
jgi:hypothetical protein